MACNCKNKKTTTPSTIKLSDGTTMILPQESRPPYTWEEIIAVKDYLDSKVKTEEGKKLLVDWTKKHFGEELIGGYCDPICVSRTRKRLDMATQHLQEYEAKNKK